MITVTLYKTEDKASYTHELRAVAEGGSPFVMNSEGIFQNVASPADMMLLPDTPGEGLYRSAEITLMLRDPYTLDYVGKNLLEQIAELNSSVASEVSGAVLYSNIA